MVLGNVFKGNVIVFACKCRCGVCKVNEFGSRDRLIRLVGRVLVAEEEARFVEVCHRIVEPISYLNVLKACSVSIGNGLYSENETGKDCTSLGSRHIGVGTEGIALVSEDIRIVCSVVLKCNLWK